MASTELRRVESMISERQPSAHPGRSAGQRRFPLADVALNSCTGRRVPILLKKSVAEVRGS